MLWLLRYIKGFLMIEIWGDTAEQLINRAVKNRILLWNLEYMQNKIICSVTIKDFRKIFNLHKFKGVNIEKDYRKVVIYARVSTKNQNDDLKNQVSFLRQFCIIFFS